MCEGLIDARGHVYPSTLHDVSLYGMTNEGQELEGQAIISDADCSMRYVSLHPADAQAYPAALRVIREANFIVLGPGSLFTSIIPNLLVPGVVEAIREAHDRENDPACTLFVCSLADMQGETWGMNCYDYVDALTRHGMRGLLDIALIKAEASRAHIAQLSVRDGEVRFTFDKDAPMNGQKLLKAIGEIPGAQFLNGEVPALSVRMPRADAEKLCGMLPQFVYTLADCIEAN